jgi:hypothetical protein
VQAICKRRVHHVIRSDICRPGANFGANLLVSHRSLLLLQRDTPSAAARVPLIELATPPSPGSHLPANGQSGQKGERVSIEVAESVFPFSNEKVYPMQWWPPWSRTASGACASGSPATEPHCGADRSHGGPPSGSVPPQSGHEPLCGGPQGGGDAPQREPRSDASKIERASKSLDALAESWAKAAETGPTDTWIRRSPKELAVEFSRTIYARPELIGFGISSQWIRRQYPIFCRSLGITWPPRYEDFSKELASSTLLPRKRIDRRPSNGKRQTSTLYLVPHRQPHSTRATEKHKHANGAARPVAASVTT